MKKIAFLSSLLVMLYIPFTAHSNSSSLAENIAAFDAKDCEPVVNAEIDKLGIDRSKITQMQYVTNDIDRRKFAGISNYQAWLSFSSCKGNYVINMNKSCQIETTWGADECKLDDIRK